MLLINVSVMLLLMLSLISLPYMSSKDISFGIKIPRSEFNNEAIKALRTRFVLLSSIAGISGLLVAVIYSSNVAVTTTVYMLYIVLVTVVFVYLHDKMKKIKNESNWETYDSQTIIVDTNFRKNNITVSNKFYGLNVMILVFSALIVFMNTINVTKDVIMMMFIQVFMLALFLFVNRTIKYSRNNFSEKNTKEQINKAIESKYVMSLSLFTIGLISQLVVVLGTFTDIGFYDGTILIYGLMIFQFVLVAYLIIKFIRLERNDNTRNDTIEGNDDNFWKYGLFYYNKNDPAILVKKRVGIGYTFNHARKSVIIFYVTLVTIIVLSILFEL
ncbi:MAG: DUF5808 domain-containing protein [Acidaminobacteraceae bacterium]